MADLKTSVYDLNFSNGRIYNVVINRGIKTLGDFTKYTKADLLRSRGMGKKSLECLEKDLKRYGVSLKPAKQNKISSVAQNRYQKYLARKRKMEFLKKEVREYGVLVSTLESRIKYLEAERANLKRQLMESKDWLAKTSLERYAEFFRTAANRVESMMCSVDHDQ